MLVEKQRFKTVAPKICKKYCLSKKIDRRHSSLNKIPGIEQAPQINSSPLLQGVKHVHCLWSPLGS